MDDNGTRDVAEFINVSKDDVLAWPAVIHRTYPATVYARMESTLKPFVEKSLAINNLLFDVLNDRLGLPKGTLAAFHKAGEHSRSLARVIRAPPYLRPEGKAFVNPHTDYGSLVRDTAAHVVIAIQTHAFSCRLCCTTVLAGYKFYPPELTSGCTSR